MPEPLSPLFEEIYLHDAMERAIDEMYQEFKMPGSLEDFIERPLFVTVNGFAYCRANYRIGLGPRSIWVMTKVMWWYMTSLRKLFRSVIPEWRDVALPAYLSLTKQWSKVDAENTSDFQIMSAMRELACADASYWFRVSMVLGIAKVTDDMLHWFLTSRLVKGDMTSGMFLRGFPSKTIEAQEQLERIAHQIRASQDLRQSVQSSPADDMIDVLEASTEGQDLAHRIRAHLQEYGHQIYSLDFFQPTQLEDPRPVLMSLKRLVVGGGTRYEKTPARNDTRARSSRKANVEDAGPDSSDRVSQTALLGAAVWSTPRASTVLYRISVAGRTSTCIGTGPAPR